MTQKMLYKVYNNDCELVGEFVSIYDMEHFMDDVRNSRGERYKELPRLSVFDYIKSIGYYMEIDCPVTVDKVAQ
ncbi:hypothetical protein [Synechococcus phage metaG-MbCM1]|jgi:hypothetical protein|uniref:Uncharacterized protein n=1 Tax=Synechococcus phage metaG-MbCM1 TaxID=1079999 RepID=H8ZN63_9CAUD|nr:hypothetical protein [Synechococcus phage metaG-MbCM1]AFD02924.1 hypothetical protein [Synechococcus phage metaG-MbCM1]